MKVDRIASFLCRFQTLVEGSRSAKTHLIGSFLDDYRRHLSSKSSEQRFNVLDLFGVGTDEVRHSSILAWLLTPHGSHGCGPTFLHALLGVAGIESLLDEDLLGCRVRTEYAGTDSIIDILVYKPSSFVLYVENKVLAAEGPRQIDREFADMVRFGRLVRVPRDRMFAVFLTPSGRSPTSGDPSHWSCASYAGLASELERLAPTLPPKAKYFIEDLVDNYWRLSTA